MTEAARDELERDPERGPLNWAVVAVAVVTAGFQLYAGLEETGAASTTAAPSTLVGVGLLVGVAVFFTDYWRPALYLLGAFVGLYVLAVWLLGPTAVDPVSLGTGSSATLLAVLCLVVFYREQVAFLSGGSPGHRRQS